MNEHGGGFKARTWYMAAVLAALLAGCGSGDEIFGTSGAGGGPGPAGAAPSLGAAAPHGIATRAGLATAGAVSPVINGDVAMVDTLTCNAAVVPGGAGSAGLGVCAPNPPTLNGTAVISPAADPVFVDLNAAYIDLTTAIRPGGTLLGGATVGTGAGACAGVALGCQGNATLPPGLYRAASDTSIGIDGILTLDAAGNSNAVFIFQMGTTLTTLVNSQVVLAGGARASNVFWQVGSSATLGTTSVFNGNVLAFIDLTLNGGATSCGRTLSGANTTVASGATTLGGGSTVSVPGNPSGPPTCQ